MTLFLCLLLPVVLGYGICGLTYEGWQLKGIGCKRIFWRVLDHLLLLSYPRLCVRGVVLFCSGKIGICDFGIIMKKNLRNISRCGGISLRFLSIEEALFFLRNRVLVLFHVSLLFMWWDFVNFYLVIIRSYYIIGINLCNYETIRQCCRCIWTLLIIIWVSHFDARECAIQAWCGRTFFNNNHRTNLLLIKESLNKWTKVGHKIRQKTCHLDLGFQSPNNFDLSDDECKRQ